MSALRVMKDDDGQYWVVRVRERQGESARHGALHGPFEKKADADAKLKAVVAK